MCTMVDHAHSDRCSTKQNYHHSVERQLQIMFSLRGFVVRPCKRIRPVAVSGATLVNMTYLLVALLLRSPEV